MLVRWEIRTLIYISDGYVKWCSHFGSWFKRCFKKYTSEYHMPPVIPLLGGKKNLRICSHSKLYINFHRSIVHNTRKVETVQVSSNWWMDTLNVVYVYSDCYSAIKQNERYIEHTWKVHTSQRNLKNIKLSGSSQVGSHHG